MITLADIVRRHGPEYRARFGAAMPRAHRRALDAITRCRTAAQGGHIHQCADCGHTHYRFHSCHHRSCPQCGGGEARQWLERQCARLLPVPYFMVTFTLPEALRDLCRSHQRLFYKILFEQSARTLKEVAAHKQHLGAEPGFTGVLHTWSRQLIYHPHVHYIVPGGGLRPDGRKWRKCRRVKNNEPYLLPVRVLSACFRNGFAQQLKIDAPELHAAVPPAEWERDWVVHSQPAGSGIGALTYLSAYIYRTALSNKRILADHDGRITFAYTESGTGASKTCTLEAMEFMRRVLQHVLPPGLHKIRYFGWMHPRARARFLLVQTLLAVTLWLADPAPASEPPPHLRCPHCGHDTLVCVARIPRAPP